MNKTFYYGKIFGVLVFAFIITSFVKSNFFLGDSYKIRPNSGQYISSKIKLSGEKILAFLKPMTVIKNNTNETVNNFQQVAVANLSKTLKPIASGVRASQNANLVYTVYDVDKVEWVKIKYTLRDGEVIDVTYPKGENPPPKEIYENK